jgi:hypothetical protein
MLGTDSTTFAIARYLAEEPSPKLTLRRVRLCGDYESGSRGQRYWGQGAPLYRAESADGELTLHTRAASREQAKAAIAARVKGARFTR